MAKDARPRAGHHGTEGTWQARGGSSNPVKGLHGTGLKRLSGVRRRFLDEGGELLNLLIEHFELFACVCGRQLEQFRRRRYGHQLLSKIERRIHIRACGRNELNVEVLGALAGLRMELLDTFKAPSAAMADLSTASLA
jgi:hypothetical protein